MPTPPPPHGAWTSCLERGTPGKQAKGCSRPGERGHQGQVLRWCILLQPCSEGYGAACTTGRQGLAHGTRPRPESLSLLPSRTGPCAPPALIVSGPDTPTCGPARPCPREAGHQSCCCGCHQCCPGALSPLGLGRRVRRKGGRHLLSFLQACTLATPSVQLPVDRDWPGRCSEAPQEGGRQGVPGGSHKSQFRRAPSLLSSVLSHLLRRGWGNMIITAQALSPPELWLAYLYPTSSQVCARHSQQWCAQACAHEAFLWAFNPSCKPVGEGHRSCAR